MWVGAGGGVFVGEGERVVCGRQLCRRRGVRMGGRGGWGEGGCFEGGCTYVRVCV